MNRLMITLSGAIVGIVLIPSAVSIATRLIRGRRRKEESGYPDLDHLREGEEVVWVGGYPYIVGGTQKR